MTNKNRRFNVIKKEKEIIAGALGVLEISNVSMKDEPTIINTERESPSSVR